MTGRILEEKLGIPTLRLDVGALRTLFIMSSTTRNVVSHHHEVRMYMVTGTYPTDLVADFDRTVTASQEQRLNSTCTPHSPP